MATPRRLLLPFYNANQNIWCAPAPIGSNINDGFDQLYPKETIIGAIDGLAAAGCTGGTINIAPGTHIGGEVPGQGLWLTYGDTLYPGWRKILPNGMVFRGYGAGTLTGEFEGPTTQILAGNAGDVTKPSVRFDVGVWVTNNQSASLLFENLMWLNFSIGRRIAVNGNPGLNPDAPAQRTSAETVAGVNWSNCIWQNNGGSGDIGQGPVSDEGYSLFCEDVDCAYDSYPDIAPLTDDRHASRLIKPSDGTTQLRMYHCRGSHSGVVYYNGPSTWGLVIDGYTIESDFVHTLPSVVTLHGLNSSGVGYISGIESDDAVTPSLLVDNSDGINSPTALVVNLAGYACRGPMWLVGVADAGQNTGIVTTPAGYYQQGIYAGRVWADMDNPRWNTPVITNRLYNMVPQRSSSDGLTGSVLNPASIGNSGNATWTQAGATGSGTVNSPIADRRGTNTAIRVASTNGSAAYWRFFLAPQAAAVGDIWIAGAWVRTASAPAGPTLSLIINNTGVTSLDHGSSQIPGFGGDGQWQFVYGWAKVLTSTGAQLTETSFYVNVYPGTPVDIDGRFLIKVPANSMSQSEFGNLLLNLQSYVQAPTGVATTQPGQMLIAQGGIGVGNAAAASTVGTIVAKMPIYDNTGTLLGYVPISSSPS